MVLVGLLHVCYEPGWLVGNIAGLLIERLRVRIPAGAAGEFSSPESTLCADSLFGVRSIPVPKVQMAGCT